jgi:hypothetical protein
MLYWYNRLPTFNIIRTQYINEWLYNNVVLISSRNNQLICLRRVGRHLLQLGYHPGISPNPDCHHMDPEGLSCGRRFNRRCCVAGRDACDYDEFVRNFRSICTQRNQKKLFCSLSWWGSCLANLAHVIYLINIVIISRLIAIKYLIDVLLETHTQLAYNLIVHT